MAQPIQRYCDQLAPLGFPLDVQQRASRLRPDQCHEPERGLPLYTGGRHAVPGLSRKYGNEDKSYESSGYKSFAHSLVGLVAKGHGCKVTVNGLVWCGPVKLSRALRCAPERGVCTPFVHTANLKSRGGYK